MKEYLHVTSFIKKAASLILVLSFITSCEELNEANNPGPEANLSSMSFGRTDLRPLQVASVTLNDVTISKDSYTGSFGGMEIDLKKVNSSTLAFLVPENIEPGLISLELTINDSRYKAGISILENLPFSDPVTEFDRIYDELLNNDFYNGVNVAVLNTAREEFYNLSEEEQQQAAQMLVNNDFVYEQLEAELKKFEETAPNNGRIASFTCGDKCMVMVGGAVAVVTAAMSAPVAAVGLGIFIGTLFEPIGKIVKEKFQALIEKVNQGLELAFGLAYNRMAKTEELVFDPANNMVNNRTSALPDTIYIKEDEVLNLSLKLYKTPLISELNRGSFYLVDQLLDLIYELQDKLANIYNITSPPDEVIQEYTDALEKFTLSSDNEDIVIDGLYGTPEEAQVYFITGEAKDQPFNLIIGYEDENSELTEVKLTLKLETYQLKKYLMLNDNGSWGHYYESGTVRSETRYYFNNQFKLGYYHDYEDSSVVCYGDCLPKSRDYTWQVIDESTLLIHKGYNLVTGAGKYEIWSITEQTDSYFKYTVCSEEDTTDEIPISCSDDEYEVYENWN